MRLSGEISDSIYSPVLFIADAVQAGHASSEAAGSTHSDSAGDHQRPLAVREDAQAAGRIRTRVHQV